MEELFVIYLREIWGDKIANLYENGDITIEQLRELEDGYRVTAANGERFNGLETYN